MIKTIDAARGKPNVNVCLAIASQALIAWAMLTDLPHIMPLGWLYIGSMLAVSTLTLARSLSGRAMTGGHDRNWGSMALLGIIGAVVVYSLPDRTLRPARGFPVPSRDLPSR